MTTLPLSVPGELRIGGGRAEAGGRFEVRDPATADVLAEVHDGGWFFAADR